LSLSLLYFTVLTLISPLSVPEFTYRQEKPVTIGLLVPDPSYTGIVHAAEQAVKEAMGSSEGPGLELVVRSTEGPWGAGSKESVSLVYEDEVRAYVGALDGRNAHLAEQVAAKSHLAYLETRATDPTLSQAYVPWFMRMVPSDDQQARAILSLIGEEEAGKITILSEENYDTKYGVKSLLKFAAMEYGCSPFIANVDSAGTNIQSTIDQIIESGSAHLLVPFCSEASLKIIAALREQQSDLHIYGTLAFSYGLESRGMESRRADLQSLEGMILLHSYLGSPQQSPTPPWELPASYVYDAFMLILNAIHSVGPDRQSISDYILREEHPMGKTGPCRFDDLGNRTGELRFVQIRDGLVADIR